MCTYTTGDKVCVKATGITGTVVYVYTNGFLCVDTGTVISGGVLNNDSTYRVSEIALTVACAKCGTLHSVAPYIRPRSFWDAIYAQENLRA